MGSDPEARSWREAERWQARLRETAALRQRLHETVERARATREEILRGRAQREILHHSAFARLMAKQETMPVIEQAKGIIMAQQRCGPEEAFELLRQASQRTNVKLHVLAARIVEHIADADNGENRDNVTAITLGATRYQRPGKRRPPPGDADRADRVGR